MTIYCVLIKIVSTIFGANLSLKPFWVLIMTYVKNHFSPTMKIILSWLISTISSILMIHMVI